MDLYNKAENTTLGNELILLIDKWPDCDQERAIELLQAFNAFARQGGNEDPEVKKWGMRDGPIYAIKRDPERQKHFMHSMNAIEAEIASRGGTSGLS